jgi:hypothetical protein
MAPIEILQGIGELKELGLTVKYRIEISEHSPGHRQLKGEGTLESATSATLPDFTGKRLLLTLEDGTRLHLSFAYPNMFYVVSGN